MSDDPSPAICVDISPTLGIRGVIANINFKKGDIIEICPVIKIPTQQSEIIEETIFDRYVFAWDIEYDVLPLGYGCLYNHSYSPNGMYERDFSKEVIRFLAYETIKKDDEITINYNGVPHSKVPIGNEYLSFDRFE